MTDLRAVLWMDAVVCFAFGATFLLFADALVPLLTQGMPDVLGVPSASVFRLLGGAVLAIGLGVTAVARMARIHVGAVAPILAVEVVWLAASAAILVSASDRLTTQGLLLTLAGAAAVAAFLVLEARGVRSLPARSQA